MQCTSFSVCVKIEKNEIMKFTVLYTATMKRGKRLLREKQQQQITAPRSQNMPKFIGIVFVK